MSSSSQLASCDSGFAWMTNGKGQDPCTVAAWIIGLGQDPNTKQPATLAPLTSSYLPPNGTSANSATCSWALYNTIQACVVCQNSNPEAYGSWSSSCDVLGQTSNTTYWQSSVSFSARTQFPRWAILNPSNWDDGTFNATQAEEISSQNLPDVTDTLASQPSVSSSPSSSSSSDSPSAGSKKTNVGAIAGGVVAGVVVLLAGAIALWFFLFKKRRRRREPRKHVDLDADVDGAILGGGDPSMVQGGNPLASHLRSQSLNYATTSPTSTGFTNTAMQQQQQQQQQQPNGFQGYPLRSQTLLELSQNGPANNAVVGFTRTAPHRTSRESIPTVAEQLDEKRRIRAERQNPPSARRGPSAGTGIGYAGTVTRTGSSANSRSASRANSMDELTSGSRALNCSDGSSTGAVISHIIPRSLSHTGSGAGTGTGTNASQGVPGKKHQHRRLSLKHAPWNRRRAVVNVGSDVGSDAGSDGGGGGDVEGHESTNLDTALSPSSLPLNVAPLPLGGTVAAAGQTTTPSDVIAAVPGARLPTARDRVNPPPEYTSAPA